MLIKLCGRPLKKVVVQMSDDCAVVLKQYCALFGITQSQALYEAIRHHIHKQAYDGCQGCMSILDNNRIPLDKRAHKDCYGYRCKCCVHDKGCRVGQYTGDFELDNCYKHLSTN